MLLRPSSRAVNQLVFLELNPKNRAEVRQYEFYLNRCKFAADKFFCLTENSIESRSLFEDNKLDEVNFQSDDNFKEVAKISNYVINSDFSQAFLFCLKASRYGGIQSMNSSYVLIRVDLKNKSSEVLNWSIPYKSSISCLNSHFVVKEGVKSTIYYFSDEGAVLPINLGFEIVEKGYDFHTDKSCWVFKGSSNSLIGHGDFILDKGPHLQRLVSSSMPTTL